MNCSCNFKWRNVGEKRKVATAIFLLFLTFWKWRFVYAASIFFSPRFYMIGSKMEVVVCLNIREALQVLMLSN